MRKFNEVLIELRNDKGMSQRDLAEALELSYGAIGNYENGSRIPRMDTLDLIADYFNVDMNFLLGKTDIRNSYQESINKKQSIISKIKLYQNPVSAGLGAWLDEGTEYNYIEIEEPVAKADFALKVRGDSMSPMYNDGDVVFIKSNQLLEPGQIGIFLINGEGYLKQLQGNRLVSINNSYDPITVNEDDEFMVVGKVVDKK